MEAKEWNNDEMNMVKQLLDILEQQNMRRQSQDFMEAVQYVAGMQVQLASMADELHNLKEQLADMQASGKNAKDGLSAKLDKIREKTEPEKTTEKGEKGSLKEKLAHMQEKAGAQNRKPDLEKSDKKKEAVI